MTMKYYQSILFSGLLALGATGCNQNNTQNEGALSARTLQTIDQASLHLLAESLEVKYRVLSNIESDCPEREGKKVERCFSAFIDFTSPSDISVKDWNIYYSQVYPIYAGTSETLSIDFVNGDIHTIAPTERFTGFKKGQAHSIKIYMAATHLTHSQLMPNYWITGDGLEPSVIASTRTRIDPETRLELTPWIAEYNDVEKQIKSHPNDINQYADAKWLFEHNADTQLDSSLLAQTVIPTPKSLVLNDSAASLDLGSGLKITYQGLKAEDVSAAFERLEKLGIEQSDAGIPVNIRVESQASVAESYQFTSRDNGIDIVAEDTAGAFYAIQTLASLLNLADNSIPLLTIQDAPEYAYRGQHLDVARNFHDKAFVLRLIEQMAAYKLNKLHMHLAEDEAWRIELPSLPELTEIGSTRCMDLSDEKCLQPQLGGADASERDGYYSIQDYIEILKYAGRHHIQVIPSLDMPGHSRAAVKAMEARYRRYMTAGDEEKANQYLLSDLNDKTQYRSIQHYNDNTINVCLESSYAFVDRVLQDVIELHASAAHPMEMYHIGADETAGAWIESPACEALVADTSNEVNDLAHLGAHFIQRVSKMIADKGLSVGGWNDGLGQTDSGQMPQEVYSYIWGALPWGAHVMTSEQAHRGWNVVLSIPDVLYFDFPYEVDPKERGYNWASRRVDSRNLFNFMPNNLPVHAEFRVDTLGHHFESNDTLHNPKGGDTAHNSPTGDSLHKPLPSGYKVAGIQGQVWSETIRSETQAEYMLYPRMIALAERAWHSPSWAVPYNYDGAKYNKDTGVFSSELRNQRDLAWKYFSNAIAQKELIKLDKLGVFYRVPTVGAKILNGQLHINSSLPGLPLEYRSGAGEWHIYHEPVKATLPMWVRARNAGGDRAGRSLLVE